VHLLRFVNLILVQFMPFVNLTARRASSFFADIIEEDCKTLDAAMTQCSKRLPGHDQAAAARAEVPEPVVLKADIEALENWVAAIRKRRS
jgi:hypothetical protein